MYPRRRRTLSLETVNEQSEVEELESIERLSTSTTIKAYGVCVCPLCGNHVGRLAIFAGCPRYHWFCLTCILTVRAGSTQCRLCKWLEINIGG